MTGKGLGEIVANKILGKAKISHEGHMVAVAPTPGAIPELVAGLLVDKGADADIEHVGGYCFVGAVPSADQLKALKELKPKDPDRIWLDVIGNGHDLEYKGHFKLTDRINSVVLKLKEKTGKKYRLKNVGADGYLEPHKTLEAAGLREDPVLYADLESGSST